MNRVLLALFVILALPTGEVAAAKPINNLENVTIPVRTDGNPFSLQEIQAVVIDGCAARGWAATLVEDGLISADITVRGKHYARIEIPFSQTDYSIFYADSNNLDYNEKRQSIHRNYNNWVIKLSGTINQRFGEALHSSPAAASSISSKKQAVDDLYVELSKLGELRDKGVLTEEEFEEQKRKLLEQD